MRDGHSGESNTFMRDQGLENAYAYAAEMQARNVALSRYIRRSQLRQIVPLADTTVYEMEQRKDFPRRIYLTPRVVVWSLAEVEAWMEQRRRDSEAGKIKAEGVPDVRKRKSRVVRRA